MDPQLQLFTMGPAGLYSNGEASKTGLKAFPEETVCCGKCSNCYGFRGERVHNYKVTDLANLTLCNASCGAAVKV